MRHQSHHHPRHRHRHRRRAPSTSRGRGGGGGCAVAPPVLVFSLILVAGMSSSLAVSSVHGGGGGLHPRRTGAARGPGPGGRHMIPRAVRNLALMASDGAFSSSSAPPPPSSPVVFLRNEVREFDRAWVEIRRSCVGCWSGSMGVYSVERSKERSGGGGSGMDLVPRRPGSRRLNFRLRVRVDDDGGRNGDEGTWTVWNLIDEGDEVVVPLRRVPPGRPSQLKVAFDGVILRVPRNWSDVPRVVLEIGFWDRKEGGGGRGMRRTAVFEYDDDDDGKGGHKPELGEISVVQMEGRRSRGFVGSKTCPDDVDVLPTEAPFSIRDLMIPPDANEHWTPVGREALDLRTMERSSVEIEQNDGDVTELEAAPGRSVLHRLLHDDSNDSFARVLPNGLCVSVPRRLGRGGGRRRRRGAGADDDDDSSCVFAHRWAAGDGGLLQAVEVEYDADTADAVRATMHSFRRRSDASFAFAPAAGWFGRTPL